MSPFFNQLLKVINMISGEITPERMKGWSQRKTTPVADVTGDRSKVQCCKQQYCIGTGNVRSMSQGKLEAVKQEMASMNTDILGISDSIESAKTRLGANYGSDYELLICKIQT